MITRLATPTHIAEGSKIQGDLNFSADAEIYGTVEGNIHQDGLEHLIIGHFGLVHGNIESRGPVTVFGRVEGNISSETQITIHNTARIQGGVAAPSLAMRPGAIVNGAIACAKDSPKHSKLAA